MPLSVDARPTVWAGYWDYQYTTSADRITPVAALSDSHGWQPEMAHEPSLLYIPYLITGDWYYLHLLQLAEAHQLANSNPGSTLDFSGRHAEWAYIPGVKQPRGQAWGQRDLAHTVFCSVDGTPEKTYFEQKLNYNLEIEEGRYNITDGRFYDPGEQSPWYWGRNTVDRGNYNPLYFLSRGETGGRSGLDTDIVATGDSPWMFNFKLAVWQHLRELGFPSDGIITRTASLLINQVKNPDYNPFLSSQYRIPVKAVATGTYFTSWADVRNGYLDPNPATLKNQNQTGSYSHIARGTSALLTDYRAGSLTGTSAYDWYRGNLAYQDILANDPRWAFIPRAEISNVHVRVGATTAVIEFVAPSGGACSYHLGQSAPASTLDGSDTPIPQGNRQRVISLTGLTQNTQYYCRITCGPARITKSFATLP